MSITVAARRSIQKYLVIVTAIILQLKNVIKKPSILKERSRSLSPTNASPLCCASQQIVAYVPYLCTRPQTLVATLVMLNYFP